MFWTSSALRKLKRSIAPYEICLTNSLTICRDVPYGLNQEQEENRRKWRTPLEILYGGVLQKEDHNDQTEKTSKKIKRQVGFLNEAPFARQSCPTCLWTVHSNYFSLKCCSWLEKLVDGRWSFYSNLLTAFSINVKEKEELNVNWAIKLPAQTRIIT